MKKLNLGLVVVVLIAAVLLGWYIQRSGQQPVPTEQLSTAPPAQKQPIVHPPAEEPPQAEPLELQQPVAEAAPDTAETVAEEKVLSFDETLISLGLETSLLRLDNFIQRLVSFVDTLPEKQLPPAHLPIVPPGGKFFVAGEAESLQIANANYQRYTKQVKLLETLDPDLAIDIYLRFYPSFQTAYRQLGYKNAAFNDRLVFVINHLLETPQTAEPVLLKQPKVLYTYADPELERLSPGQKILLRLGPAHRQTVLRLLTEYRDRLITLPL